MTNRRRVLMGLAALGLPPLPGWAGAGSPHYIAAARTGDDSYALIGLTEQGTQAFAIPLPGRGHAAAAHPTRAEAVGFARRPGQFALVLDCRTGAVLHELHSPEGRHFYGHGAFSADGALLFTTENDYEAGAGLIGVWDTRHYTRIGEYASGGVGPHELRLMPDGQHLIVANGGIETHPASGRTKLNLPTMEPNLSYLTLDGQITEQVAPPAQWHKSSLRHLAVGADGTVAIACQWQGDPLDSAPLLALHHRGEELRFAAGPDGLTHQMQGYAGSIAISRDGNEIALTSPRGGVLALFDPSGTHLRNIALEDVCGVAPGAAGFVLTTGTGIIQHSSGDQPPRRSTLAWDNHLVEIAPAKSSAG